MADWKIKLTTVRGLAKSISAKTAVEVFNKLLGFKVQDFEIVNPIDNGFWKSRFQAFYKIGEALKLTDWYKRAHAKTVETTKKKIATDNLIVVVPARNKTESHCIRCNLTKPIKEFAYFDNVCRECTQARSKGKVLVKKDSKRAICEHCKKVFIPKRVDSRFCSPGHRQRAYKWGLKAENEKSA